ncbi:MAG: ATP-binding protein [Christensenellaceae bacterium]|jgi:AAA+ ATPase superfamily predicted ATPase|nr:ATP-binding protein [Christensenellaceae bacterium]
MSFVGRNFELGILKNAYNENEFSFIPIYGRRGVGKSRLIQEFARDKLNILLDGMEYPFFLEDLKKLATTVLHVDDTKFQLTTFSEVLDLVYKIAQKVKLLFIIDETQFFAEDPNRLWNLQYAIDHKFVNTNMMLIVSGSSLSFMKKQILGYESPIYGRRTEQLYILPLKFTHMKEFVPGYSLEDQLIIFAATGGIPRYLNLLKKTSPLEENLIRNFFSPSGFLLLEPGNLFQQEFNDPAIHESIVKLIANGTNTFYDIKAKLKLNLTDKELNNYIESLLLTEIIKAEVPAMEKFNSSSLRYRLKDEMYRFWYCIVEPHIDVISGFNGSLAYKAILPELNSFLSTTFENICIQYMIDNLNSMPMIFGRIGRWWGNNNLTKSEMEIDFIAHGSNKMSAIFGECKWTNKLLDKSVIDKLLKNAEYFSQFNTKYYYFFTKSGFTKGAQEIAQDSPNIKLITFDEMFPVSEKQLLL